MAIGESTAGRSDESPNAEVRDCGGGERNPQDYAAKSDEMPENSAASGHVRRIINEPLPFTSSLQDYRPKDSVTSVLLASLNSVGGVRCFVKGVRAA